MTQSQPNEIKGFKSLDDIPARVVFEKGENSTSAAREHLQRIVSTAGVDSLPLAIYGMQADGSIDWGKYADSDIYCIMLRNKGAGFRALVVQPAPTIETLLTSDAAKPWVKDLLVTQVAHKMVRSLRAPKGDVSAPITDANLADIPHSIADYVASQRLGGAVALWNTRAKKMIDLVAAKIPAFAAQRFTKDLLRKAIESSAYARAIYPKFENAEKGSIFVKIANTIIEYGRKEGSDTSLLESWLENRDRVALADAGSEGIDDFDDEDLFGDGGE